MVRYPFSPELLDALPEELAELFRDLEMTLLEEICSRLKVSGQLNEVTVQDIRALRAQGIDLEEIKRAVTKTTGVGEKELGQLLDDVVARNQAYYTELIDLARVTVPDGLVDHEDIYALYEQTRGTYRNLTRSMGFLVRQGGRLTMLEPARAYQWALDAAVLRIQSGAISYNQAVAGAIRQLADSGLKTVSYESGHVDSVDVAVRRAVMTGINQLNQKYREQSMDYLETDLVEVTAHLGARNTDGPYGWENHAAWQGKVYRWASKPRASSDRYPDFEDTCGLGSVTGIGGANCRHSFHPYIEGVMERTYSDDQLEAMKPENRPKTTFEGREYDDYQATQKQRQIERTIRKLKRRRSAFEAAGLADDAHAAGSRLRRLQEEYRDFSKAARLPEQRERLRVLERGGSPAKKALETKAESGIIKAGMPKEIPEMTGTPTPMPQLGIPAKMTSGDVTEEYLHMAAPGQGSTTYDDNYDTQRHKKEIDFAKWLHDTIGGDIQLLNESTVEGEKRADYLWRGRLWDLKDVSTEKAANTAIKRGLSQIKPNPGGIILNYGEQEINLDVLLDVIDKRMQWLKDGTSVDIMLVLKDGELKVLRYNKKG